MFIAHEINLILLAPVGATYLSPHAAPTGAWLLEDFQCYKHSAPLVLPCLSHPLSRFR